MKKAIAFLLAAAMIFALAAVGGGAPESAVDCGRGATQRKPDLAHGNSHQGA